MMTRETPAPRRLAMPAAALIGALALAGCSSGNIGESWQCPLAKGGSCESVAGADPAVPDMGGRTVLGEPLWLVRESAPEAPPATVCEAACAGGFDPFGWLIRLFGGGDAGGEVPAAGHAKPAPAAAKRETPLARTVPEADMASSPAVPEGLDTARSEEPAAAAIPAEAASLQAEPAQGDPVAADLRTGEVVARIWIAPFVDADGVYREASHVRVVLEPAGWRLK